ncbi:hypothetical protein EDD36DRAFT_26276 [Exophiala viscosa]|uniref:Uncharacterized protein n=1 Tax=Exophiala viscosa TaxID=2486360 RepID=A0AAN6E5J2_9EURO|nr:hypothetical protein EDD36DRAFT_26276 [Exophiala viscosa]
MADSGYPDDIQFAGLVQAATAAADEQTRDPSILGKRKRHDNILDDGSMLSQDVLDHAPNFAEVPIITPQLNSSASVLFREPSSKSKKYSRPPLGRVFTSLELAPENFLRLQNAAKDFMLDDAHPERRDVVGQKKNTGGADVAKLNLWNCVEEFLSLHGYGERYFTPGAGEGIPGAPQRTIFWPRDSQTIVKLMMPLMRKMVTNERQRVYAAASRKSGSKEDAKTDEHLEAADDSILQDESIQTPDAGPLEPVSSTTDVELPMPTLEKPQTRTTFKQSIVLYVNVVSNTGGALRRVIPRFQLTPESAPSLSSLIGEVEKRYKPSSESGNRPVVKVWLTDGLVTVAEDGEWMVALLSAGVVDWMDGEVRVLVEI